MASTIQVVVFIGLAAAAGGCEKTRQARVDIPALSPGPTTVILPDTSRPKPPGDSAIQYEVGERGGIEGRVGGPSFRIWADGTVLFDDPLCKDLIGAQHGSLPAARVTELLDAIERGGVFGVECTPVAVGRSNVHEVDQSYSYEDLTVRRGSMSKTLFPVGCGNAFQATLDAARFVLGPSPCARWDGVLARIEQTLAQLDRDIASEVAAMADGRTERATGEARMTAMKNRKQDLERRLAQVRRRRPRRSAGSGVHE